MFENTNSYRAYALHMIYVMKCRQMDYSLRKNVNSKDKNCAMLEDLLTNLRDVSFRESDFRNQSQGCKRAPLHQPSHGARSRESHLSAPGGA